MAVKEVMDAEERRVREESIGTNDRTYPDITLIELKDELKTFTFESKYCSKKRNYLGD